MGASDIRVSGILEREENGRGFQKVIPYVLKTLSDSQKRYCTCSKEILPWSWLWNCSSTISLDVILQLL